ncbi:MAG: hypothetical protein ACOY4T_11800 [Pseudomonadota bacterium]
MRTLPATLAAHLATRPDALRVHTLVWITAKDRATGLPASMGLWNGFDHQQFDLGGIRDYYGAGTILGLDRITYGSGLSVRMHSITLAAISPEVEQAVRGYDARLAPVEVHGVVIDPVTNTIVGAPWLALRGWVDEVDIRTPATGGEGGVELRIASAARALTRKLELKRSDASHRLRSGDRFRRYAEISGSVSTAWGEA